MEARPGPRAIGLFYLLSGGMSKADECFQIIDSWSFNTGLAILRAGFRRYHALGCNNADTRKVLSGRLPLSPSLVRLHLQQDLSLWSF